MLFGENSREDYVVLNLLHSEVMKDTGDPWGQRDAQLTRAAVSRPFRTAFGQEIYGDIYMKAAALLDAIVNRVVFRDGNKRTALLAAVLYLGRNDKIVSFGRKEGEALMWYVVLEHPKIEEIADWLKSHTLGRSLATDGAKN
ncbi:MAG: death on curing protein [Candidatus Saccharibacteria bacterium]|nr:death on curing protein [Candidatus Saccharibacteria bacterium]